MEALARGEQVGGGGPCGAGGGLSGGGGGGGACGASSGGFGGVDGGGGWGGDKGNGGCAGGGSLGDGRKGGGGEAGGNELVVMAAPFSATLPRPAPAEPTKSPSRSIAKARRQTAGLLPQPRSIAAQALGRRGARGFRFANRTATVPLPSLSCT